MKNKKLLSLILILGFSVIIYTFFSREAMAKGETEMHCQPINWYIGDRLHKKKSFTYQYDDNTVRCENSEVICYIYHGQLSCIKN